MNARWEHVRHQAEAVDAARGDLVRALEELSEAAKNCAKKRVPIEDVYAATNRVRRAEEAHDLAELDLATARGEDA